jgi:LysR family glycine cleavage system transcriptional activator
MSEIKQMPPLNWLRSFEACARLGSFSLAAKELNITQPAVSHQIRLLETFLNCALFEREGRRKKLSDAGHDYIFFVREAFDLLRVGSEAVFNPERGNELTLRVNMSFTLFWLMPRLDSLYAKNPWLRLNILPHISDKDERPSNFEIEIVNLINYAEKNYRPLRQEYFFPVASPKIINTDLLDVLPLFDSSSMTASWKEWFESEYSGPKPSPVNYSSTVVVSLMAAINGVGLALAHTSVFESAAEAGQLIRPYQGQIKMKERYFISEVPETQQTPASRAFMEWVSEQLSHIKETQ